MVGERVVKNNWLNLCPNACIEHLPRITSDYCPLLLSLDKPMKKVGPKPFRFDPMWLHDQTFDNVVIEA